MIYITRIKKEIIYAGNSLLPAMEAGQKHGGDYELLLFTPANPDEPKILKTTTGKVPPARRCISCNAQIVFVQSNNNPLYSVAVNANTWTGEKKLEFMHEPHHKTCSGSKYTSNSATTNTNRKLKV